MSQEIAKLFDNYNKIIIEIGSGDGRLLSNLTKIYDKNKVLFIGIEIDRPLRYSNSCNRIDGKENKDLQFINEPFEKALENFYDNSIDTVISVLPHPTYIDKLNQKTWIPIYKTILDKIKVCGYFILVTELIDDFLSPFQPQTIHYGKSG